MTASVAILLAFAISMSAMAGIALAGGCLADALRDIAAAIRDLTKEVRNRR